MNEKDNFINWVNAVNLNGTKSIELLSGCIDNLENGFAQGYLAAMFSSHNKISMINLKYDLLDWAKMDIWK
jgi:hypothetical protein